MPIPYMVNGKKATNHIQHVVLHYKISLISSEFSYYN
jgi:hypothetical protein